MISEQLLNDIDNMEMDLFLVYNWVLITLREVFLN